MIVVTPDQTEAMTMGDRIVVMSGGRLEQIGTPDEIYSRPATRFVGGFIGSPPLNLIDGALAAGNGGALFVTDTTQLPLRAGAAAQPNPNVTLGIGPESILPVAEAGPETIPATVYAVEHLGRESILIAERGSGDYLRAVIAAGDAPRVGEAIAFGIRADAMLHVFDNTADGAPVMMRARR